MTILTSYTSATYKAQIRSSVENGFKQIYSGTCTESAGRAARNLVAKWFGEAAAKTVREVKDRAEIDALVGNFMDDPNRKQVFDIWTFDQSAKEPPAKSPLVQKAEALRAAKPDAKDAAPEVTTERPKDPAWDGVRATLASVQDAGRKYLYGKAWLGWQLFMLKKANGVHRGQPKKNSDNLSEYFRPWSKILEDELDMHERTANRLIERFEAVKAKAKRTLKSLPGGKNTLTIFQSENPLALPPEQQEAMLKVITSLCDGESEGSLMEELKIIPTPALPPAGKKQKRGDKLTPEQLAFDFFDGPASAICRARASAEYKKLLHMLPAVTDEEGKVSLTFLRDEVSAMLEDLDEALALHAKPANRKA